jgi:ABC-type sugar transport system substrate-binding protein
MSTLIPKYPHIRVRLVGEDGNAFAILGRTKRALQNAGASADDVAAFLREATAGTYDELLATVMRWVEAE